MWIAPHKMSMPGEPYYESSDNEFPILIIPKSCTTLGALKPQSDMQKIVYLPVTITTPDRNDDDACLYNGFINIKVIQIDRYDVTILCGKPKTPEEAECMEKAQILTAQETSDDLISAGQETSDDLLSAGPETSDHQISADQKTSDDQISADQEASDNQISVDQETSDNQISADQETSANQISADQETSANQISADQETSDNQISADQETSDNQISADQETSDNQISAGQERSDIYAFHRNLITVNQYNTFITENLHDYKPAVRYGYCQEFMNKSVARRKNDGVSAMRNDFEEVIDYEVLPYCHKKIRSKAEPLSDEDIERQCTSFKGPMYDDGGDETLSGQQKTIVYLGTDARRGQTIQQMAYNDPEVQCCIVPHAENEIVIESNEHPVPNRKKYQCANCQQIFGHLAAYRNHMRKHNTTATVSTNRDRSRYPHPAKNTCPECSRTFKDQNKFLAHCMSHGDPDVECPKCRKVLASKSSLRAHLKIHKRKYSCKRCSRMYADLNALKTHMSSCHSLFMCTDCDYVTSKPTDLLEHQAIHEIIYKKENEEENTCNFSLNLFDAQPSENRDWTYYGDSYEIAFENHIESQEFPTENADEPLVFPTENTIDPLENPIENSIQPEEAITDNVVEPKVLEVSNTSQDKEIECDKGVDNENNQYIITVNQENDDNIKMIDQDVKAINQENNIQADDDIDQNMKAVNQKDNDVININYLEEKQVYQEDTGSSRSEDTATGSDEEWRCQDYSSECDTVDTSRSCSADIEISRINDSVIASVLSNDIFLASKSKRLSKKIDKTCNICTKSFNRVSDIKRHLIEHLIRSTLNGKPVSRHGNLDLICQVCRKQKFSKVDQYKAHLRRHTGLTLYQCRFCTKSFSDSSNFSKHKKLHSTTFYQCDLCQRKFNSKRMLIQHMEYHKEHAPLPCSHCKKSFFFESTLNKHVKSSHTKLSKSRFRCQFCLKYFTSLKDKWDHEWKIHKARKMVVDCMICGAKYRKYLELKRHCRDEHNLKIGSATRLLTNNDIVVRYN